MVFGHGPNTFTRMPAAARGLEKLDLLVVCDPHPTTWAVLGDRKNGTYLLPTCTQYESRGTRTASNGSLQPYEQIVKPIFESKHDGEIFYRLAKKLGLADRMFKDIKTRERRSAGRGRPARDQSRRLVDRLYRPIAGTPEGASAESGEIRSGHACARPRTIPRSAATITVCRGRAGARRSSSIRAPRSSTTPTCM